MPGRVELIECLPQAIFRVFVAGGVVVLGDQPRLVFHFGKGVTQGPIACPGANVVGQDGANLTCSLGAVIEVRRKLAGETYADRLEIQVSRGSGLGLDAGLQAPKHIGFDRALIGNDTEHRVSSVKIVPIGSLVEPAVLEIDD